VASRSVDSQTPASISLQLEHYLDALALKPYAVNNALVVRELPEPYQQARKFLCGSSQSGYL
jgi:hypothetical protein